LGFLRRPLFALAALLSLTVAITNEVLLTLAVPITTVL
jgi:hypothetical protein